MNKNDIFAALHNKPFPLLANEINAFTSSEWTSAELQLIEARGKAYLATPTPMLPYHLFSEYQKSGNRESYQKPYYDRRGRLMVFAILAWHSKGACDYVNALQDIIWEICSEAFWCLPAHFLDVNGDDLDFGSYSTTIDLFASETAFALSEALELCCEYLAPNVIAMVDEQLYKRIFNPFLHNANLHRFETMRNNWSGVCGGAVGACAIYRIKDTKILSAVLHRVDSSISLYISSFGRDGVCVEGVDYWSYGFGFYTAYADLLYKRTGGALDLLSDEKSEAIASSFSAFYLDGTATISFSDGSEGSGYRMGLLCYLAKHCKGICVPPVECAAHVLDDTCYRFCLGVRDILWYDGKVPHSTITGNTYFANAKYFIAHTGALALAAKGGNNGESHNHNDCGSFIVAKNGVQLLCDLGAGLYDAAYFSDTRYDIFVNRSLSHNVAIIDNNEQKAGAQYSSKNDIADENTFSTELSGCYESDKIKSYLRNIKAENGNIVLEDTFSFTKACTVTEVFVSRAPIMLENNCAYFARGTAELKLQFQSGTASLDETIYTDHHGNAAIAYRLLITLDAANKSVFNAIIK